MPRSDRRGDASTSPINAVRAEERGSAACFGTESVYRAVLAHGAGRPAPELSPRRWRPASDARRPTPGARRPALTARRPAPSAGRPAAELSARRGPGSASARRRSDGRRTRAGRARRASSRTGVRR
ncbi:hypothetical protein DC432_00825 [Microbacterium testaceum]|uniref:Uncharacterized protein n=1 Tax=Microbacterium testaceum TaxID=2033 RepID=A0A2T7WWX1_MICTE|nr:hypothetical protein DC432_00825 [Microbacterium testaceum]